VDVAYPAIQPPCRWGRVTNGWSCVRSMADEGERQAVKRPGRTSCALVPEGRGISEAWRARIAPPQGTRLHEQGRRPRERPPAGGLVSGNRREQTTRPPAGGLCPTRLLCPEPRPLGRGDLAGQPLSLGKTAGPR
jgi:hypothetical protein